MRNIFPFLLLILFFGCSGEPGQQATVEIPEHLHDIENLTVYPADASPTHTVDFQVEQVFGDTDTLFFSRMTDFAVDAAERVYIKNSGGSSVIIHAFLPDGSYLGSVGREGSGPGEYSTSTNMQVVDDRLFLYDLQLKRASSYRIPFYDFDFAFLPAKVPTDSLSELQGTSIQEMYVTRDERFLFRFQGLSDRWRTASPNSIISETLTYYNYYLLLDKSGQILSEIIFTLPGKTALYIKSGNSISFSTLSLFGNSLVDIGPDDQLYTNWTQDFLIKKWDAEGNYQSAFYYPFPKQEFVVEAYLDSSIYADNSQRRKSVEEGVDFPEFWPLIESMLVDDQNRIWVATADQKREMHTWTVLQNDGKLITQFEWPKDYTIEEVKNGYLYSHETDEETGLESLVKYQIQLTEL